MELLLVCPACQNQFKPRAEWQKCCTPQCTNRLRQQRFRARHRKRGGGDSGPPGGGGPTLFDSIDTVDSQATFVLRDRTGILSTSPPDSEPAKQRRKPSVPVSTQAEPFADAA